VFNASIGDNTIGVNKVLGPGGNSSVPNANNIALAVTGTGSLTLTAANDYKGNTTVNGGGTLLINGNNSSTTTTATITNASVFGGSGTYAGAAVIGGATTAKLLPAGSGTTGTFTVGSLSLNPSGIASGASADFDISGVNADKVLINNGGLT